MRELELSSFYSMWKSKSRLRIIGKSVIVEDVGFASLHLAYNRIANLKLIYRILFVSILGRNVLGQSGKMH